MYILCKMVWPDCFGAVLGSVRRAEFTSDNLEHDGGDDLHGFAVPEVVRAAPDLFPGPAVAVLDPLLAFHLGEVVGIDAPWPSPSSPPQGNPMSGFNLRTQSCWRDGLLCIDFHNVPYFWKKESPSSEFLKNLEAKFGSPTDLNPSAIPWREQHPLILEAIVRIGLDAAEVEKFREASGRENPGGLAINLPLVLLKQFVDEFDRQLAG
jgi:hypothetical protein